MNGAVTMSFAAALALTVTIWSIYRAPRPKINKTTARMWGFTTLSAIAVLLRIDYVHIAINHFFGVTNLAWFLSYTIGAFAIYLVTDLIHIKLKLRTGNWVRNALIGTLLVMSLIFPTIAQGPDAAGRRSISSFAECAFLQVLHVYLAFICFHIFRTFMQLEHGDTVLHIRLRWLTFAVSTLLAGVHLVIKISVFDGILYFFPSVSHSAIVNTLWTLNELLFILAMVSWPLFFLPKSTFQRIARLVTFADKLLVLRDLDILQKRIAHFCPPVVPSDLNRPWWLRSLTLDYNLYRAIIAVLDGRKSLSVHPGKKAQRLYQALNAVQDDADYQTLVSAYREIGKQLRKGVAV